MSHYEKALYSDRLSSFEKLARRQHELAEVRRGKRAEHHSAHRRFGLGVVTGLRSAARRRIKGRRSLS